MPAPAPVFAPPPSEQPPAAPQFTRPEPVVPPQLTEDGRTPPDGASPEPTPSARSVASSGVQLRSGPVGLPEAGEILGRYRILRVIGAGGMGTVFEAEHVVLEKRVALKVLKPELAAHEELRKRFVREGLSASRVRHPHVVDVTDAADENGRAYLVMELLEGRSLYDHLVEHGPLDVETTLEMVLPICSALAVAHAVGVVHRDVKPENVFLVVGPGNRLTPKLVDFGISDTIDATRDENAELMGTPHYMAPEQVLGRFVDGHADQYAVGVMMFELLTGRLPYDETLLDDPTRVMSEVANGCVHQLADALENAPTRLAAAVARMTAHDPNRRFRTMDRVGRALMPLASPRTMRRFRDLIDPGWSTAISLDDVLAAMPSAPALDLAAPLPAVGPDVVSLPIDAARVAIPLPLPSARLAEPLAVDLGPPSCPLEDDAFSLEDELVTEPATDPAIGARLARSARLEVVTDAELVEGAEMPALGDDDAVAAPSEPRRRARRPPAAARPAAHAGLRQRAPVVVAVLLGLGAAAWAALPYSLW